jgi:hypothetical protein
VTARTNPDGGPPPHPRGPRWRRPAGAGGLRPACSRGRGCGRCARADGVGGFARADGVRRLCSRGWGCGRRARADGVRRLCSRGRGGGGLLARMELQSARRQMEWRRSACADGVAAGLPAGMRWRRPARADQQEPGPGASPAREQSRACNSPDRRVKPGGWTKARETRPPEGTGCVVAVESTSRRGEKAPPRAPAIARTGIGPPSASPTNDCRRRRRACRVTRRPCSCPMD